LGQRKLSPLLIDNCTLEIIFLEAAKELKNIIQIAPGSKLIIIITDHDRDDLPGPLDLLDSLQ
jgi:hypothetical protein